MLKTELNGKRVKIFSDFRECKVREYRKILRFCENQSTKLREAIDTLKFDDLTEEEMLKFLLGWVHTITGFSIENVKKVPFDNLMVFWEATKFILTLPEDYEHIDKINGVSITESVKTFSGIEILGGKVNYEQWLLMNKLNDMGTESLDEKHLDMLKNILAIAYPVENESEEAMKKRLDSYEDLSVYELYSGWFFFVELLSGYTKFFRYLERSHRNYQKALVEAKYQRVRLLESLSNLKLGKFSPLKWLKPEFMVLELNRYIKQV